jgi:hypothetical protein
MSCVDISPEMSHLLATLRGWPVSPEVLEQIQAMPEWEEAEAWGWIMRTGALTGTGAPPRRPYLETDRLMG